MSNLKVAEHLVIAQNTGHGSDNKIHDDKIAQKFGFSGALVPGVDVYAYMTHAPVSHWGADWLRNGFMHVRLAKPVYEGDQTVVSACLKKGGEMIVSASTGGPVCGEGEAFLEAPTTPSQLVISRTEMPEYDDRPVANQSSLAINTVLGARDEGPAAANHLGYLTSVGEDLPIYDEEGWVHPGYILRRANLVLRENVCLGPWIHVESWIWNLRSLDVDEFFTTRAVVTDNFERKGHLFVDLDVLVAARDEEPVTRIMHRSIYVPRQLRGDIT